jgi:acyl-CoA synthetase (AMP-forming)/AMP-acid ligase II
VENQNPGRARALAERTQTLAEDDGALMVFTGGVTGMPKGAVLSHKNIIANIAAQNRNLGWRADDRVILHLPMSHVSGATLLTVGALMSGATLVMIERFHPERTLAAVQREQVTILGQVPTMWVMEFSLPNFGDYDLSSVRMTIVSGAPTPDEAMRSIAAIAPTAHHVYGLTEAAGMVTHNQPGDDLSVLLHVAGRTNPEFEIRIVDGDRKPVGPGREGEIAVRGDCVMTGYFEKPEETANVIDEEGWLYTGDRGRLDENDYLTVTGLIKKMYFSGGYNVYPAEVEAYLDQHPDIAQCACSGVPHPVMGETGGIWIVPKAGAELSRQDIRAYCKAGLARYKRPTHIHIVDALP